MFGTNQAAVLKDNPSDEWQRLGLLGDEVFPVHVWQQSGLVPCRAELGFDDSEQAGYRFKRHGSINRVDFWPEMDSAYSNGVQIPEPICCLWKEYAPCFKSFNCQVPLVERVLRTHCVANGSAHPRREAARERRDGVGCSAMLAGSLRFELSRLRTTATGSLTGTKQSAGYR